MKSEIIIEFQEKYSKELEELRLACYPGTKDGFLDPFNHNSQFLVLKAKDKFIGSCRFSSNPNGVFITETKGLGNFRTEPDTIDLTRAMIHPEYRGKGLYEMLILLSLQKAKQHYGAKYANGAVKVEIRMIDRLKNLHFQESGNPVIVSGANGRTDEIIPLICDLEKSEKAIEKDLIQIEQNYLLFNSCIEILLQK